MAMPVNPYRDYNRFFNVFTSCSDYLIPNPPENGARRVFPEQTDDSEIIPLPIAQREIKDLECKARNRQIASKIAGCCFFPCTTIFCGCCLWPDCSGWHDATGKSISSITRCRSWWWNPMNPPDTMRDLFCAACDPCCCCLCLNDEGPEQYLTTPERKRLYQLMRLKTVREKTVDLLVDQAELSFDRLTAQIIAEYLGPPLPPERQAIFTGFTESDSGNTSD